MSKIDDIETLSQAVSASTMLVLPRRCSFMRSCNSKCRNCLKACPTNAIKRSMGRLSIDSQLCTNCGACATVCPTGVFATTAPSATEIVRQARDAAAAYGGIACFACAKDAEELGIDASRVVILPCLDYLDEYLIIGLFSCGISKVAIFKRNCEGCAINGAPQIDATVAEARKLCKAWSISSKVKIFSEVPPALCNSKSRVALTGDDKREAFRGAGTSLMGYAADAVNGILKGKKTPEKPKEERIIVKTDEKIDPASCRAPRVLNMLNRLGIQPQDEVIESKLWSELAIDMSICRTCGCCSRMCPTGALMYDQREAIRKRDQMKMPGTLSYDPSRCIACGLCKDSCHTKAMSLNARIPSSRLGSTEKTVFFENKTPVTRGNLMGN